MNALELEAPDPNTRREDTILSIEVKNTVARIVRETWFEVHESGVVRGERFWVEVSAGVFTPEEAEAFAQAVRSCAERSKWLRNREEERDHL